METQNKKIAVFEVMILLVGIIAFTNLVSSYDGEGSESPLVKWMKDQIDSGSEENLNMGDLDEALCNEENCPSPEKKCNADGECVTSQPAGDNPVQSSSPLAVNSKTDTGQYLGLAAQIAKDFFGGGLVQTTNSGDVVDPEKCNAFLTAAGCSSKKGDEQKKCVDEVYTKNDECKQTLTGGKKLAAKLINAAIWGTILGGILQVVAKNAKEHQGFWNSASYAVGAAFPIGAAVGSLSGDVLGSSLLGLGSAFAGAMVIFVATYKEEAKQKKTFSNVVWQAPLGGDDCHLCNEMGILPCSEYMCRSLGKACQIVNAGTEEEMCFATNRNDVVAPEIRPWEDALPSDGKYQYIKTTDVSPPDKGVKLIYAGNAPGTSSSSYANCLPPFTPVSFGVTTNEPATCKIDYQRKGDYDNMTYYFGENTLLTQNHSQIMSLPTAASLGENVTYNNGGNFNMFVRCEDANGNQNTAEFVFEFCVNEGPDTTAPVIITTDPLNNFPIAYNISGFDVNVYTNEKAKCKWSRFDQDITKMNNTMIDSQVGGEAGEVNGMNLYKHVAKLNALKNGEENKFYFRCEDMMSPVSNKNTESYPYAILGTAPLVITKIGPNETIKDSTETVKVTLTAETFGGANEGEAKCYFKRAIEPEQNFVQFFNTGGLQHSQDLFLNELFYTFDVKCIDLGGNADRKQTSFFIDSDNDAPLVTRVYYESNYLKIATNEKAECVYDNVDCTYYYNEGTKFQDIDDTNHFTDWKPDSNYYLKCKDIYGNEPLPNKCSMIIKPYDTYTIVEDVI
ncbi:hypothetical protein J4474_04065 [Candidatus Pacearchaeota archaeon]|nr:hypothetical protein [Candidatus Pacearchaeota archaeon]